MTRGPRGRAEQARRRCSRRRRSSSTSCWRATASASSATTRTPSRCSPCSPLGPGGPSDLNRSATHDVINGNGLDPPGATSIGDGIFEGRATARQRAAPLRRQGAGRAHRRHREQPPPIADVAGRDQRADLRRRARHSRRTSACRRCRRSPATTAAILLVTGAITGDNRFLLQKYFLQILAGISNAEVVLDPDGELSGARCTASRSSSREADTGVEVVLLTPRPTPSTSGCRRRTACSSSRGGPRPSPRCAIETGEAGLLPDRASDPAAARPLRPGRHLARAADDRPAAHRTDAGRRGRRRPVDPQRAAPCGQRSGRSRRSGGRSSSSGLRGRADASRPTSRRRRGAETGRRGLPYSLVVHYVLERLPAGRRRPRLLRARSRRVDLRATLTQSGLPVEGDPFVWAEVTRPDGSVGHVDPCGPADPGEFAGRLPGTTAPGVYRDPGPRTRPDPGRAPVHAGADRDRGGLARRRRWWLDPGSGRPRRPGRRWPRGRLPLLAAVVPAQQRLRRRASREACCKASASISTWPGSA